jgi:carboxypeptidase family protein
MVHTRVTRPWRPTGILVAALVSLAFTGRGPERGWFDQQAPPPGAAMPTGSGLIVGRVVDASSDAPVGDAIVTLVLNPASAGVALHPQRVVVDDRGRFLFHDLPGGTVALNVSADGYLAGGYGQRGPNGTTLPLELGEGQRVSDVTIRLWKFAAISGSVVDEFGDPMVGVPVRILQVSGGAGPRRVVPAAKAVTDDRGAFRSWSLQPGDYIVAVPSMATPSSSSPPMSVGNDEVPDSLERLAPPLTSDGRMLVYATTFYPSAMTPVQAQNITVGSGEERSGIDVTLQLVRTASVSGSAWGPEGPASNFALRLVPAYADHWVGDSEFEAARALTDSRGAFSFTGVPPGQYLLQGTAWSAVTVSDGPATEPIAASPSASLEVWTETALWGQTAVSVGEADVVDVPLVLREGLRVSGRLHFVGSSQPPTADQLQQLSISLTSANGGSRAAEPPGRIARDGQFTMRGYLPGQYAVNLPSPDGPWTLLSMTANGHDLLLAPLALDSDVTGVVITFTDRPTQLAGAVQRSTTLDERLMVVIFPAAYAAALDNGMFGRRSREMPLSAARQFAVDGLPAGDYLVAAIPSDLAASWMDADLVAVIARQATRVTLADGDRKTVDPPIVVIR